MSQNVELLEPPGSECAEEEPAKPSSEPALGKSWGRIELAAGRVLHVWPRGNLELVEALRAALVPSRRRWRPSPTDEPSEGVLVLSSEAEGAPAMLAAVRACAATRLRPVAVVGESTAGSEFGRLADAVLGRAPAGLRQGLLPLESLAERVDELPDAVDLPAGERCELDFLRYIATRDVEELAPVPDPDSAIGYRQPLAEALLRRAPEGALETLAEIHAAGHLEARPTELIFLCGGCGSSRLSVREVCPSCRAPTLVEESVIHHFRCAHVGPSASFQRPGGLTCPKCDQQLRHAGVDHDRPGVDMRCRGCDVRVVEGIAEARCLACDRRASLDEQRKLDLFTYRPLPSLERVALRAISPLTSSTELLRMTLPTLEPAVHALMRERAEEICRRYGRPATLLRVEVQNLPALQERIGRRETRRRIEAMARGLSTIVRGTDLVSVDDHASVEVLLVETDLEGAEVARRRLENTLAGRDVVGLDVTIELTPLIESNDS